MTRAETHGTGPRGRTASYSLGVEIDGGGFVRIVDEGVPLPAHESRFFTTISDSQTAVDVHLLCGRGRKVVSVGRFLLSGIRKGRKGVPRIEIGVDVDADGIIRASARDLDTGAVMESVFPHSSLSSGDENGRGTSEFSSRVFALIRRAREESAAMGKRTHAGLLAEINDLIAKSYTALASKDEQKIAGCRTALETLLGEMHAVRKSTGSRARRGDRHG